MLIFQLTYVKKAPSHPRQQRLHMMSSCHMMCTIRIPTTPLPSVSVTTDPLPFISSSLWVPPPAARTAPARDPPSPLPPLCRRSRGRRLPDPLRCHPSSLPSDLLLCHPGVAVLRCGVCDWDSLTSYVAHATSFPLPTLVRSTSSCTSLQAPPAPPHHQMHLPPPLHPQHARAASLACLFALWWHKHHRRRHHHHHDAPHPTANLARHLRAVVRGASSCLGALSQAPHPSFALACHTAACLRRTDSHATRAYTRPPPAVGSGSCARAGGSCRRALRGRRRLACSGTLLHGPRGPRHVLFRVWCLGLGFRVRGLGFGVWGLVVGD